MKSEGSLIANISACNYTCPPDKLFQFSLGILAMCYVHLTVYFVLINYWQVYSKELHTRWTKDRFYTLTIAKYLDSRSLPPSTHTHTYTDSRQCTLFEEQQICTKLLARKQKWRWLKEIQINHTEDKAVGLGYIFVPSWYLAYSVLFILMPIR